MVICDHFNTACVEAAIKLKIPFIVSSAAPQGPDTTAPYINSDVLTMRNPTTEHMSLYHRLHDMLIKPILAYLALRDHIQQQKKILKSLNIEAYLVPGSSWKDSIKIVNSAFGFDRARPMGPLVEMIGPILPNKFAVLTPEIAQFLDNHKRVAYVAFGQHTIFNQRDVELVMTGLLEAYEANEIDGIVWATNGAKDPFTIQLSTSSSSTYDMNDLNSGKHPHVVLLDWAPQMAILNHSSTIMFISHGGIGSVHEACYAGVRLVIYPFFGDQPAIAVNVENSGIGLKLDYRGEVKDAVDIIRRVANNKDDMQANVNRFKALVQIRAKHGVFRGADIAEEVLFMNVGGKMYHRYDVKRNMSFIKANNIDIYAIILVAFSITVYTLVAFFRYTRFFSKTETKLKSSLIRSKVQAGPGSN